MAVFLVIGVGMASPYVFADGFSISAESDTQAGDVDDTAEAGDRFCDDGDNGLSDFSF